MNYDPDIANTTNNQTLPQVGVFGSSGISQSINTYAGASSGKLAIVSIAVLIFAVLNLIFLIVTAGYATGLFENIDASTGASAYFVIAFMTFIASGLGLYCATTGMRLSRMANSRVFVMINKIIFILIILFTALVLIGPVFG